MRKALTSAPSHSVLLVMDRTIGQIPKTMGSQPIAATPSCIAIGTRSEHDGETSVSLSDVVPSDFPGREIFDGLLQTPSRSVAICSVLDQVLLELNVPTDITRVRIWTNDALEPDAVAIVVTLPSP